MNQTKTLLLIALLVTTVHAYKRFPENFQWSTATSAFQVEGGQEGTGRGMSIWDRYLEKHPTPDNSTGKIACDTYHKFREDALLLKDVGVKQYRFSVSWSRIMPDGRPDNINPDGVRYYHDLIDSLVKKGIQPLITLYHWDLPLALQDRGGWLNEECVNWFGDYVRFMFTEYGDKVKLWTTINEAYIHAKYGYCGEPLEHAPGGFKPNCEWSMYIAAHNMILAHSKAGNIYKKEFQPSQNGQIGITLQAVWYEHENKPEDEEAAARVFDFQFNWFAQPIYGKEGDYPVRMRERMAELSREEGRSRSRLPTFTPQQIEEIRQSADFLSLNYYTSYVVSQDLPVNNTVEAWGKLTQWGRDIGAYISTNPHWKQIAGTWLRSHPQGLRSVLNFIREHYNNVPVYITENGSMDTPEEGLNDVTRIEYVRGHLEALHEALQDGCDVRSYAYWSFLDNFEWAFGYHDRFGIFHVDFKDPERPRTPKKSVEWYRKVIAANALLD
ncbi:hypothetical protein QR680_006775 [Steinernema hermaphroditum]|uniref:Cytosolic beta-glucosidase n=1 Tax=Steinernema hermaphroditum TaxID=289476 RepID=A0AA39HWL4_9BILA|nr:hypothetical protein QR680_006775 [Steinernema hermaphroditum]